MEEEKKIESTQNKCTGCGGDLIFSPKDQNLLCENCGKTYPIETGDAQIVLHDLNAEKSDQNSDYKQFVSNNKVFKCPNCGSNVILNAYEISKKCPYCDTSLVIDESKLPGIKPDAVIPFLFDEKEAGTKFVQSVKKDWFVPNAFKKQMPENQIKGIYIPAFSFNVNTISSYNGRLYNDVSRTDSEGHTTTDRNYFNINGNFTRKFTDILVECSSKLVQSQIDEFLPYNYGKKKPYNDGFIRGYSVEHYNENVDSCKVTYERILTDLIRSGILSQYHYDGVDSLKVSTSKSNETYAYYLVPIYRFDYVYNKKHYATYMNGQTGRVDSNVPKSKLKIAFVSILAILLVVGFILIGVLCGSKQ